MENNIFYVVYDIQVCFIGILVGVVIQDSKIVVTLELREVIVYDFNIKIKYLKVRSYFQGLVFWIKGLVFMLKTESKQFLSQRFKGISQSK